MATPKPFKIDVSEDQFNDLKQRLSLTRWPDELEDAGWQYGAPLADVRRLAERWQSGYDWRKHERELNDTLPQYTLDIDVEGFETLNIHFVHRKSERYDAIPLLFVHGWPGSFIEVKKILPLLTSPPEGEQSFHVVAIDLPNFGFSQGVSKKEFGSAQYAEVGHKVMLALGYNQYAAQGGDWGFTVTRKIALMYGPEHVKAWHTNMPVCTPPLSIWTPWDTLRFLLTPYSESEKAAVARMKAFQKSGMGYFMEQSTRPQTVGYSLSDSPVGLLAWIYEKLVAWTDNYPWTDDEVLTWISIYWFSRAGPAASARIYYEIAGRGELSPSRATEKPVIPIGTSHFPKELFAPPDSWLPNLGNVVIQGKHTSGGHFAAYEQPELLVGDIRKMFAKEGSVRKLIKL